MPGGCTVRRRDNDAFRSLGPTLRACREREREEKERARMIRASTHVCERPPHTRTYCFCHFVMSISAEHRERITNVTYQFHFIAAPHERESERECSPEGVRAGDDLRTFVLLSLCAAMEDRGASGCQPRSTAAQDRRRFHKQSSSNATRGTAAASRQTC